MALLTEDQIIKEIVLNAKDVAIGVGKKLFSNSKYIAAAAAMNYLPGLFTRGKPKNYAYGGPNQQVGLKSIRRYRIEKGKLKMFKDIKTFDTVIGATTVDYNGAVYSLSDIAQGDDFNQRTGRKVLLKSIQFAITWYMPAAQVNSNCRFLIVRDNNLQDSGTLPTVGQILENVGSLYAPTTLRQNDPIYLKRFKILCDKRVSLDVYGNGITKGRDFYKKFVHPIFYSSTAAADSAQGTILLVVVSDSVTSNLPTFYMNARLRFIDG